MYCGVLARRQLFIQAPSVFYFRWGKLETIHGIFAQGLVGLVAHTVFDPNHEDPATKRSSNLSVPLSSFAHVPFKILHQFSFVLQTFIVASHLSSFEPTNPVTEVATNHQYSFPLVVISYRSSFISHLRMFLLGSVRESLRIPVFTTENSFPSKNCFGG